MSSRYADKHHTAVECAGLHCENMATKLLAIRGVPYWFCESCYEARRQGRTA